MFYDCGPHLVYIALRDGPATMDRLFAHDEGAR